MYPAGILRDFLQGGVRIKVLICDDDAAYVEALVKHVVSESKEFEMTAYSHVECFVEAEGRFDVAVLSKPYMRLYEDGQLPKLECHHVLYLMGQADEHPEGMETIAKYQSMRSFMAQIRRVANNYQGSLEMGNAPGRHQIIGVFSPIQHELKLPFALCLSAWCGQHQPVLFINLEELSVQSSIMDCEGRKDLLDLLYVIENRKKDLNLNDFICESEGVAFIPPMNSPSEMAYITGDQWTCCREKIREQFSGTIIVLMDHIVQGFEQMISACDGLILLTKPGNYYRKSVEAFRRGFVDGRKLSCWMEQIALPMSAGKQEENYDFAKLLNSKLGEEIRRELEHVAYLPR